MHKSNLSILRRIHRAFSRQRSSSGKRQSYPVSLKRLVLAAIKDGIAPSAIAKAAGVSCQSVVIWRQDEVGSAKQPQSLPQKKTLPCPVQLKLIRSRGETAESPPLPNVRIFFRGGAYLECPSSAISAGLVAVLNGVES